VRRGYQRRSDEAVTFGEFEQLCDGLAIGQRVELDVEPGTHLDERIAAVLVSLRHDAFRLRNPGHLDTASLGMELEARERAAGEPREEQVLSCPVGLRVRGLAEALGDRELEPLWRYPGQRVITTFFSV
jgi:hypothetical protein